MLNIEEYQQDEYFMQIDAKLLLTYIVDLYRLYQGEKYINSEIVLTNTNSYKDIVCHLNIQFINQTKNELIIDVDCQKNGNEYYEYQINMAYFVSNMDAQNMWGEKIQKRIGLEIVNNLQVLAVSTNDI